MSAPEPPLLYQGVARSSPAFRLLKQMGWEEGEGLGKAKQGITTHVRVRKKHDNAGVGVDAQQKAASNWRFNTALFDNILKNLTVVVAGTNDEESKKSEPNTDKMVEQNFGIKKVARPQGRYKKRENGKLVHGYSQTDLAAILGIQGSESTQDMFGVAGDKNGLEEIQFGVSSTGVFNDKISRKLKGETVVAKDSLLHSADISSEVQLPDFSNDWWGQSHGFVRGGLLGATHQIKVEEMAGARVLSGVDRGQANATESVQHASRVAFCEQDQEKLYKLVQDKAAKGRQGLGIGDRPKKIGGARWKGQKIILDNMDEDYSEKHATAQESCLLALNSGSLTPKNSKGEHRNVTNSNKEISEDTRKKRKKSEGKNVKMRLETPNAEGAKLKWRRLCEQLLQEAPAQTMSIKRLQKNVVGICQLLPSYISADNEDATILFTEKLGKSSRFVIKGKKVSLAGTQEQA